MRISPISCKAAVAFVERVHRHLPHAHHRLWALGCWRDGALVGVAVVGVPTARMLCAPPPAGQLGLLSEDPGWPAPTETLEVVRCAVAEGNRNACSMLYGGAARAARGMGAGSMLTYTAVDEPGTSLRAAGWIPDEGVFGGGQSSRPSRPRAERTAHQAQHRVRWWAPWSERLQREEDRVRVQQSDRDQTVVPGR